MNETKIIIGNLDLKVKQSFRALMMFEEMTGKSVNQMNENLNDIMKLFYCVLKANNRDIFVCTFDEYIDLIDENPTAIEFYTNFLQSQAATQTKDNNKKKVMKR